MTELLRYELEDGGHLLVEVGEQEPGVAQAARAGRTVRAASESFQAALESVRTAAATVSRKLRDLPERPDRVAVRFGVRLNAEAGAVIAKTGAEGHLELELVWERPSEGEPPGTANTSDWVEGHESL